MPAAISNPYVAGRVREGAVYQLLSLTRMLQGGYVKEQCDGEECWCVDTLGARMPDTFHPRWGDPIFIPCGEYESRLLVNYSATTCAVLCVMSHIISKILLFFSIFPLVH